MMRRLARPYAIGVLLAALVGAVGAITLRIVDPVPFVPDALGFSVLALVGFEFLGVTFASVGDRARYDAERTVAGLAGRLRDEVDMARLRQEVLDVGDRSVEPTDVHRWLRPGPAR